MSIAVCALMDNPIIAIASIMLPFVPVVLSVLINAQWDLQKEGEMLEETKRRNAEKRERLISSSIGWFGASSYPPRDLAKLAQARLFIFPLSYCIPCPSKLYISETIPTASETYPAQLNFNHGRHRARIRNSIRQPRPSRTRADSSGPNRQDQLLKVYRKLLL